MWLDKLREMKNESGLTTKEIAHLDLICEALDCDLEDLIIRIPNSEPRVRTRTGFDLHTKR